MNKSKWLVAVLWMQALGVLVYTVEAFRNEGPDLFGVFFSNLMGLGWNGQFCLDFSSYLMLSGIWIVWRNKMSVASIPLALAAAIIGIMVFAPYLLYLLVKEKGSVTRVLIGDRSLAG